MAPGLREAVPADAPAIAALHVACWQHNYRGLVDQAALDAIDLAAWTERRARFLALPDRVRLTAWEGDALLGFCDGGPAREERFAGEGEIYALYVRPGRQGRGLGSRLFRAACERLRARGYGALLVKTLLTNPQSRGFYEREGCVLAGESAFEFAGRRYPEAIYRIG